MSERICRMCGGVMASFTIENTGKPFKIIDLQGAPSGPMQNSTGIPRKITLVPYKCADCGFKESYRV